MPRTKLPKKGVNVEELLLKTLQAERKKELKEIMKIKDHVMKFLERQFDLIILELPYPNKTLDEIEQMTTSTLMRTACDTMESSVFITAVKSIKQKRSLSCAPDDDGGSTSSCSTRTSRARSRAPLANSTSRVSRSVSRSRIQQLSLKTNSNTKNNGYKTPTGKRPGNSYGMVTPKMQPNAPQLILRRPNHGEIAISMEGSPLMVNPVAADNIANVNIPLGEGKLLSLQPERGLRISLLPQLDAETQRQLMTLGEHIQKICAARSNGKGIPRMRQIRLPAQKESGEVDKNEGEDTQTENSTMKQVLATSDSEDENEKQIKIDNDNLVRDENEESTGINPPLLNDIEDEIKDRTNSRSNKTKSKCFKLIDSDSESEINDNESKDELIETPVYIFNDKKGLVPERNIAEGLAALCDPDSSDEDENQIQPLAYKKKAKKKDEEREEKRMTAKEAAEQRKEIESVSQRMLRETYVSLPYHKPKQRSLKEFLQNRPRFASTIPANVAKVHAAVAIKMNQEQLDLVSKKMAEREKQVKEFYKSESEEEEEEENDKDTTNDLIDMTDNSDGTNYIDNAANTKFQSFENGAKLLLENEDQSVPKLGETVVQELKVFGIEKDTCRTNVVVLMDEEVAHTTNTDEAQGGDINVKTVGQFSLSDMVDDDVRDDSTSIPRQAQDQCLKDDINTGIDQFKKSALQLLKEQLGDSQPKLSGAPNYVIDLDDGTTHLDEVTNLMQRFVKHTTKKPLHKNISAVELDVLCVSQGGEIHKEKIAVKIEEHEEPKIEEKPGVKYQKLKNDLQAQMAMRRNELWKEKQARLQAEKDANSDDEVYKGEHEDCGIDDILDDEEEFSNSGSDEERDEEMDSENETADQSDMLDNEASDDGDEIEDQDNEVAGDVEKEEEMVASKKKVKYHRRILQPADSDSEEEPDKNLNQHIQNADKNEKYMDSTASWPDDDELISAGQTNSCHTPKKQSCQQTKSELSFLSPVCRLTGLQSFDATDKLFQNSPGSPAIRLDEPSPFKSGWSKSLFCDSPMKSTDNLEDVCSGIFLSQPTVPDQVGHGVKEAAKGGKGDESVASIGSSQSSQNIDPTTQDMLELCSGNFGFTQTGNVQDTITENYAEKNETQQNIVIGGNTDRASELAIDEDEDRLISQLIDDDDLENFKKKFESPLQNSRNANVADDRIAMKIAFEAMNDIENNVSSDNSDDDDHVPIKIKTKRKRNKIMDSDEEDVCCENDAHENIDLHDEVDSADDNVNVGDGKNEPRQENHNEAELGYDSEENEILVEKPAKGKKLKLKDFLENEAELSESEWGSEDEDERNLDELEIEMGDEDEFDQDKLKDDLEKIHMQRVLDEDKRSLKVLQEMFLDEDDELKGAGRQRQFRWKNIDNVGSDESIIHETEASTLHDDDVGNEEEWRKKRYERELFLQSQKQNNSDDESAVSSVAANNQLFKLGKRAMVFSGRKLEKTTQRVNINQAYVLNTQRGSFLSRKDEVLTRVAEYTKVNGVVLGAPKNTRNFVFQSKSSDDAHLSTKNFQEKKRKAGNVGTPTQLKRLRLNGFSPQNQKKTETKSKARLFCNSQW